MGSQASFDDPLHQTIVGIKNHSQSSVSVYRTCNTVTKGADLSIHCVLCEIEDWQASHEGIFPKEVYVQVDGGSENANKYFLGFLELLVAKGLVQIIYYTRLPTGHTHEDIDGCFGVIAGAFSGNPCLTREKHKDRIEKAFSKGTFKTVEVKDVYVLPNYCHFIEDCIDKKISRLHKEYQTQHQWRFERVAVSNLFPSGCKTTYRAYASDKVVELVSKPRAHCTSDVGRYTGLEPVTLFCRWYPFSKRNGSLVEIEGVSLLTKLPHFEDRRKVFPPVPLPDSCKESLEKTINEVRRKFYPGSAEENAGRSWIEWAKVYIPETSEITSTSYIKQLMSRTNGKFAYHIPLEKFILYKENVASSFKSRSGISSSLEFHLIDPSFKWPDILAAAMESVALESNPHPVEPRLYVQANEALSREVDAVMNQRGAFYAEFLKRNRNNSLKVLKNILSAKVSYLGIVPSLSGTSYYCYFFQAWLLLVLCM